MTPLFGDPSGGEQIDRAAHDSIRLAHKALERFPELVRKHKFIAGGAAISSSLIVLAGVAIARRIRAGQTPDEAVATVTEDEVQGLRVIEPNLGGCRLSLRIRQPHLSRRSPSRRRRGSRPAGSRRQRRGRGSACRSDACIPPSRERSLTPHPRAAVLT